MEEFVSNVGTGLRFAGYGLAPLLLLPIAILLVPKPKELTNKLVGNVRSLASPWFTFAAMVIVWTAAVEAVAMLMQLASRLPLSWVLSVQDGVPFTSTLLAFSIVAILAVSAIATWHNSGNAGLGGALSNILDHVSGAALRFALFAAFFIILIQLAAVLLRYVF